MKVRPFLLFTYTYMRLGHGPTGAIGVATDYHHMVKWTLIFALSGEVSQSAKTHVIRKKLRVESRQTMLAARACATHLMFAVAHWSMPLTQMNIVTGQIAHSGVNADNAVSLEHRAMQNLKGG